MKRLQLLLVVAFCGLAISSTWAAVGTVATIDPMLGAPILYDSGSPLAPFAPSASLDTAFNGGLSISGIEVLGPGVVYTTTDDGAVGGDTASIQLNLSAGPTTNVFVGAPEALSANSRGYDLTLNPFSGLLGVAATAAVPGGPPGSGVPGVYELDPTGVAPAVLFGPTTASPTTSGLTYRAGPVGPIATVSTDGIPGGFLATPLLGGIYDVPFGGPEALIALDSIPAPAGVGVPGGGGPAPGDDHVVTLDGRTLFLNDGTNLIHDVTGGAGATALLVDLTTTAAGAGGFLAGGGVRGEVSPVDGDVFIGWGLGGASIIRADEFGAGAIGSVIGFDSVRDIDFGPSTFAVGPSFTGTSMYVTEFEVGTFTSNIWEFGILVPEPSSLALLVLGSLVLIRRR